MLPWTSVPFSVFVGVDLVDEEPVALELVRLLVRAEVVAGQVLLRTARPASVVRLAASRRSSSASFVGSRLRRRPRPRRRRRLVLVVVGARPRRPRRRRPRRPSPTRWRQRASEHERERERASSSAHRLAAERVRAGAAASSSSGCGSSPQVAVPWCGRRVSTFARRIVAVAAHALRATAPTKLPALVAVEARERAVEARQVAADARVIEARRRERPLRVALAAAGRQRVVVDVVLAVAVDAQVARAGERAVVLVAALARDVVVHAAQREVADVVQRLDVRRTSASCGTARTRCRTGPCGRAGSGWQPKHVVGRGLNVIDGWQSAQRTSRCLPSSWNALIVLWLKMLSPVSTWHFSHLSPSRPLCASSSA